MSKITRSTELAEWISGLSLSALPDDVKRAVEYTVIDTVALAVAALDTDYGQATRQAFSNPGPCTVWGCEAMCDAGGAAVINGTCGHGEDYDNTYEGCPVHSGVVIVPALFAAADALSLTNADVLKGLAVGIEVANRLGLVAGKGVHQAGFHPTSVLGTMSAAAGVAAATGQTVQQIKDTLGVAGSLASGIIEYLADGSSTKRLHAGWAAQSGIQAARLGAAGFSGPGSVLEGVHGLYSAFAPSIEPDFSLLCDNLGTDWQAANVAFKAYACGTMTQPYIDCAVRMKNKGINLDEIDSMVCEVGEGTVHRLWEPLALKQKPPTAYAAKFSSPYTIAAGLCYGDAGLAQFTDTAVNDPQVLALAARISYVVDPDNEYPENYTGHIRAVFGNGSVMEERQSQLRGGSRQPLSRDDILKKARANLVFAGWKPEACDCLERFAAELLNNPKQQFSARPLATLKDD